MRPNAQYAESLIIELHPFIPLAIPPAGFHAGIGLGYGSRNADKQRKGVFGRGNRVPAWCIHDDHSASRRRLDIDIVYAYPGSPHHGELLCRFKNRRGHLGLTAHHQGRKIRNYLDDLCLR